MFKSKIDPNDCIVLFADLQAGIADLPLTITQAHLQKGVRALAKLAKLFGIPAIVTAVRQDGEAKIMPEIGEELGPIATHYRSTADSFLNEAIAGAVQKPAARRF